MRTYTFIVNQECFPDPFLVEISRTTLLKRRHLAFYEPNIIDCPAVLSPLLRSFLTDRFIFKTYRSMIKDTVLRTVLDLQVEVSLVVVQDAVLERVIIAEVDRLVDAFWNCHLTRMRKSIYNNIIHRSKLTRRSRLADESHLGVPSLSADIRRSIGELTHIVRLSIADVQKQNKKK